MAPYFETVKSFVDVPISDSGVDTPSFLEASDGLVKMFGAPLMSRIRITTEDLKEIMVVLSLTWPDLLGSGIFGFVQSDIRSNINGVRGRYESTRDLSGTLESLVRSESGGPQKHATACLVRLIRGLTFTCRALQNMQSDTSSELHVCFKRSYDEVLKHHHTFVIRSVVSVAIRAVPRRDDFYLRIAQGGSIEKLDAELAKWLAGLDRIVRHMSIFMEQGGYGRV